MRLADAARSRAVLIGTGQYDHERLKDQPVIPRTLRDLQQVLTDPQNGVFQRRHCQVIEDERDFTALDKALKSAAQDAEDLLFVYFVGHGLTTEPRHDLYLGLPQSDWEDPELTALRYDALRTRVLSSKAATKVIVLDCCFSGLAATETLADHSSLLMNQIAIKGTYVLTAAHGDEAALVRLGEEHTAFTGRLIKLLVEGIPDGPEYLSLDLIFKQLQMIMRSENLSTPQRRLTGTSEMLCLARNTAYKRQIVAPFNGSFKPPRELAYAFGDTVQRRLANLSEAWSGLTPGLRARRVLQVVAATLLSAVGLLGKVCAWWIAFGFTLLWKRNPLAVIGVCAGIVLLPLLLLLPAPPPSAVSEAPQAVQGPTTCDYTTELPGVVVPTFSVPMSEARAAYTAVIHTSAGDIAIQSLSSQYPCGAYAFRYLIEHGYYSNQGCQYFDPATSGYVLDCFHTSFPPSNDGLRYSADSSSLPNSSNGLLLLGSGDGLLAFSGDNPAQPTLLYQPCAQVVQGIDILNKVVAGGYRDGFLGVNRFANDPITIESIAIIATSGSKPSTSATPTGSGTASKSPG